MRALYSLLAVLFLSLLVGSALEIGCSQPSMSDAVAGDAGVVAPGHKVGGPESVPVEYIIHPTTGGTQVPCGAPDSSTHWCDAGGGGSFDAAAYAQSIAGVGRVTVLHDGGAYKVEMDAGGLGGGSLDGAIVTLGGASPVQVLRHGGDAMVEILPGTEGQVLKTHNDAVAWMSGDGGAVRQVLGVGRVTAATDGGLVKVSVDASGVGSFDAGAYVHVVQTEDLSCSDPTHCLVYGFGGVPICGAPVDAGGHPMPPQPAAQVGQAYVLAAYDGGTCWRRAQPGSFDAGAYVQTSATTDFTCSSPTSCTVVKARGGAGGEIDFGASTGTMSCVSGASACGLTQAAPSTDVAPTAMTVAAASAEPGASTYRVGANLYLNPGAGATTNGTPGNVVINVPAASGTGTEGDLIIQRGGTQRMVLGTVVSNSSYDGIWFGTATPSLTNYSFLAKQDGTQMNIGNGSLLDLVVGGYVYGSAQPYGWQFFSGTLDTGGGMWVIGIGKAAGAPSGATTGPVVYGDVSTGAFDIKSPGGLIQTIDNGIQIAATTGATADMNLTAQGTSGSGNTGANSNVCGGANSTKATAGACIQYGGAAIGLAGAGLSLTTAQGTGAGSFYGPIHLGSLLGSTPVALTCSTATVALSVAQSKAPALIATGTYTSPPCAMTSLVTPAAQGMVWVNNPGSYSVSFGWSTGSAVTIAQGGAALIGSDGANAIVILRGSSS